MVRTTDRISTYTIQSPQATEIFISAVLKPAQAIEYFQAGGKQRSAFEYGSAFSRASRAVTPADRTVFVSGTASIDQNGQTVKGTLDWPWITLIADVCRPELLLEIEVTAVPRP
jgi:hypothetical protein